MLWRKMLRDILENKIAYLACIFVIAIGLLTYTAMSMAKDNLFVAKDSFYEEYHFADGFIEFRAAPLSQIEAISDINGIDTVMGRLIKDVRVLMPDSEESVFLRLISLHTPEGNELNDIHLVNGSFPEQDQIVVGNKFLEAHQLQIGQAIPVVIDGKRVDLAVSGSGQSPEYVYALNDLQTIMPDPRTFDVAYIRYEEMEALFKQTGIINHISFTLKKGVTFEDVERAIETEMKPFGLENFYGAEDQLSNAMLSSELEGLEKMAASIPIIFLTIAAIILYIMLKRLVESQRSQIGSLKAFGYRKGEILFHYISYGLFIGILGGIIGGIFGTFFSRFLMEIYQEFFSLPNLDAHFSLKYFFIGVLMAGVFSLIASFQGARGILKLQPAEAMRPPVPVFLKKTWLEKVPGLWNLFTTQGRMALRNMMRNKRRSLFTFIGMVFTFSMMASFFSMGSMAEMMILDQFSRVQKQDVKMSFIQPMPPSKTVREIEQIDGVDMAEPFLEAPVTLKFLNHKEVVVALGIKEGSTLYHVFDKQNNRIAPPNKGLMLSEQIANNLHVQTGDVIRLESSFSDDEVNVTVEKIIPQYLGANIYMEHDALLRLLNQGEMTTSLLITADENGVKELKDRYSTSKFVGSIVISQEMMDRYTELMGMMAYTLSAMAIVAIITGFAIVYNSSIISLAERERELASLRVMGMTPKEVLSVISVEQWTIGSLGMIGGIPLAIAINQALSMSLSSDLYSLPSTTSPEALIQAFFGTILAIWISQLAVSRKVKHLDLVGVLKERE